MVTEELQQIIQFIEYHPSIESLEVIEKARHALRLAINMGHAEGEMVAKWALGIMKSGKGLLDEAEMDLNKVLLIAEELSNDKFKGRALSALGGLYFRKELLPKSLEYLQSALEYIDPFWEGAVFNNLGLIYKNQQQFGMAETCYKKAIQKAESSGNSALHISVLLNYANIRITQGELKSATSLLGEIIQLSEDNGFTRGKMYAMIHLASLFKDQEETDQALEVAEELLRIAEEGDFPYEYVRSQELVGLLYLEKGNAAGLTILESALQTAREIDFRDLMIDILEDLSKCYCKQGELEKALECSRELCEHYKEELQARDKSQLQKLLAKKNEEIFSLEQQRRQISKQNEELRQYAYIVAHDLKEPLRNISGFASLLNRKYDQLLDVEGKEYLSFIKDGTKHMYQQLEDLLTYATLSLKPEQFDQCNLNDVLDQVLHDMADLIYSEKIIIERASLGKLEGHYDHFYLLFYNLVHNAIKFRSNNRPTYIKIYSEYHAHQKIYFIKDNGIGIDRAYHNTIFKIFKRLDRLNYTGTGIGLSICQKIVQLYQGNIGVESELNKGASFYFYFSSGEATSMNPAIFNENFKSAS